MSSFGVSFSVKYARELNLDWKECFTALVDDLGVKRLRLMSYWDEIESERGSFDFNDLDWQVKQCEKKEVAVTMCLGLRQPRWPECHPPTWARMLNEDELKLAVVEFNNRVMERYKDNPAIISWQLENEALNRGIGTCIDYNRDRLKREYTAVKAMDASRNVLMSTSNSVGLPLLGPIPDIVGFSIYRSQYDYEKNRYTFSKTPAIFQRLRAGVIRLFLRKKVVIHELQTEPWGPKATVELSDEEQAISMNPERFRAVIEYAENTGIEYMDLWGGEWWYWRKTVRNDNRMWQAAAELGW